MIDETPETPDEQPEEAAPEAAAPEEAAPEAAADEAPEAAPEESAASDDAATEAPAAEPVAQATPQERKRASRARRGRRRAETPEERAAERRAKAAARSRRRSQEREKAQATRGEPVPPTPARERPAGTQKLRQGIVVSDKADKTITVRIDGAKRHRRYEKIVRSSMTLHAHDETNDAGVGDTVRVVECRPLSRTKRWRLVEILERAK